MRWVVVALAAVASVACVGKLSVGVTHTIDPTVIAPGAQLREEILIEGDGLLGAGIRQALAQGSPTPVPAASGVPWQIRDNSSGDKVQLRFFRTVDVGGGVTLDAPAEGTAGTAPNAGRVEVRVSDVVVARTYDLRIVVPPNAGTAIAPLPSPTPFSRASTPGPRATPTLNPTFAQIGDQTAALLLSGLSFDHYANLPGVLTATNGTPGDNGRLVWHVKLDAKDEQVLSASSVYVDWPRLAVLALVAAATVAALVVRGRRRPAAPVPPIV